MPFTIRFVNQKQYDTFYTFLVSLPKPTRAKVSRLLDILEKHGHLLTMPYVKKINENIWELRVLGKKQYRIFYSVKNNDATILHWFSKKTNKTPVREIKLAKKRLTEL